ncbi:MAG: sulfatase [Candidatus Solibacter usitatus]|nr:sulfatase [Candidatus Solibacter usitatus]
MSIRRRDLLSALAPAAVYAQRRPQRPNILFFFADDWGRYAGVYRDASRGSMSDVVKTPNIDRVAREGVLFTNAFMATPSCTPSRAAVSTGCYSFRTGRTANLRGGSWKGATDPGESLPGFGAMLEKSGYLVRSSYKTLQANWLGGKAYQRGNTFLRYSQYVSEANAPSEASRRRKQIEAQAVEGVRRVFEERLPGQPFFYVHGPINTHRPWVRGSGKKLWDIDPESLKGKLPEFLPDNETVREDVADYLGEAQALDMMVGAMWNELASRGELENTVVVLSGDNGMGGMPRGKCNLYDFGCRAPLMIRFPGKAKAGHVAEEFVNLMDLAPTFLDMAGIAAPAAMDGRSLVPMLTGARDASRDFVVLSRERHVPDARAGNLPYPSRAIRTKDFLYIRNFKPDRNPMGDSVPGVEDRSYQELAATHELLTYKDMDASPTKAWILKHRLDAPQYYDLAFGKRPLEELYDLRADPDQTRNVAAQESYAPQRQRLWERLNKVMRQANDPRLSDAFDRTPYIEEA